MKKTKRLLDEYRFPGFYPKAVVKGKFGDPRARVVELVRCQKKLFVAVAELFIIAFMTARSKSLGICLVATQGSIWRWRCGELIAGNV